MLKDQLRIEVVPADVRLTSTRRSSMSNEWLATRLDTGLGPSSNPKSAGRLTRRRQIDSSHEYL